MHEEECPTCHGNRLDKKVLSVYVDGKTLMMLQNYQLKMLLSTSII